MDMVITVEKVLLANGWSFDQTLTIEKGRIVRIENATDAALANRLNGTLLPGYFDTQVNGGGGVLFNHQPSLANIEKIALAHLQYGTTSLLPTIITDNASVMSQAADAIAEALSSGSRHVKALVKGVHFEGPFLSVKKKGVHDASFIRTPSDEELATLCRQDIGKVLLTIAPETVSTDFIREMVSEGVTVAIGHTNASYETIQQAIDAGATGFTHLYNAMSALTSREPGAVGAALLHRDSYCGLIIDHQHLHPRSAELALKIKGDERAMLVTDAMAHVGSNIQRLSFFDTEIIRHGDKLTTADGKTLAGSCLDMHSALLNAYRDCNITLASASKMASITPARFMALSHEIGSIEEGKCANFVLLDARDNLKTVWLEGVATVHK